MHQWSVTGGRLILIAGTDADTTSYKRSFTFYFQESADASWNHVPIVESSIDFTKTWFSVSRGESTLADAVVIAKEGSVRLITASREKSGLAIKVARYLLVQDDVAFPDGPGHVFKKISSESIPITRGQTIAHVLIQEAAMARKN
jgi:hypothetical protein